MLLFDVLLKIPLFIFAVFYIISLGLAGFMPKTKKEAEALGVLIAYIVAIIITVVYFILPIDIIPDAAIGIGQVDDIGVGVLAFTMATAFASALTQNPKRS